MKLTDSKKKKYLDSHGGYCPFCGGSGQEYQKIIWGDGFIVQPAICPDCHQKWEDVFMLAAIKEEE